MIAPLLLCLSGQAAGAAELEAAERALDELRFQEALALLEAARGGGPYRWEEHVRLEELLGTARAYLGKTQEAEEAFLRLLALDPRHAVRYTLSPKVTFVFERAREKSPPPPALEVRWPDELRLGEPIPLQLEVVADPLGFLRSATLHYRLKGEGALRAVELALRPAGQRELAELPALAARRDRDEVLELWLTARNARGDEVYRWYSADRPRDLTLRHVPPDPWYGRWWVWVLVGGTVAAAGAGAAFALSQEPDRQLGGAWTLR